MWLQNKGYLIKIFEFNNLASAADFAETIERSGILTTLKASLAEKKHFVTVKIKSRHNTDTLSKKEQKTLDEIEEIYFHI
ncbi:MAG TPA: hypothetical protein PLL90_03070 [Bacteroidales bacterium]|nr:hypothetical protein [Bacteroidales bacterium]